MRGRTGSACTANRITAVWRNKWCGRKAFDAWILYDTSEWNVQHFQWSTSGIGKPKIPMITAAVALVVDVIVVVALLMFTDLGIYALLVAMIVYAIVVCVMNDFFMKKYLGYKNPWKAAYVSPLIASAVMGVVAAGVYYGFHAILPSNIICLGVSIILAAAAYFLVYILVDKTASERLSRMPGGAYLVRIAQRIRR